MKTTSQTKTKTIPEITEGRTRVIITKLPCVFSPTCNHLKPLSIQTSKLRFIEGRTRVIKTSPLLYNLPDKINPHFNVLNL